MTTIYTVNNKVLKNSTNDKWLTKKAGPVFEEVTIGTQTWMTKNLAIDDGGEGIEQRSITYDEQPVTIYFYTWYAAKRIADNLTGWRLPTRNEFATLINYVGNDSTASATALKSTYGWTNGNGTDSYGFTALPTGFWGSSSEQIQVSNKDTTYWTSTISNSQYSYYYKYSINTSTSNTGLWAGFYCSVRLIKDIT